MSRAKVIHLIDSHRVAESDFASLAEAISEALRWESLGHHDRANFAAIVYDDEGNRHRLD